MKVIDVSGPVFLTTSCPRPVPLRVPGRLSQNMHPLSPHQAWQRLLFSNDPRLHNIGGDHANYAPRWTRLRRHHCKSAPSRPSHLHDEASLSGRYHIARSRLERKGLICNSSACGQLSTSYPLLGMPADPPSSRRDSTPGVLCITTRAPGTEPSPLRLPSLARRQRGSELHLQSGAALMGMSHRGDEKLAPVRLLHVHM